MRISARVDYAVRAMLELSAAPTDAPMKAEQIAVAQEIPLDFLLKILSDLRVARLVVSRRGYGGGFVLARPAAEISIADVIRGVEGPLADVHGSPPEAVDYQGSARELRQVWLATRAALREVLEVTTLAHVAQGQLPKSVANVLTRPGVELRRGR